MAIRFAGTILALGAVLAAAAGQDRLKDLESRAAALKAAGDAAGALAAWQQAAALDPQSAHIEDEIGFLLAVLNRREEAVRHLERAVELDPRFAPAQYHLGVALWLAQNPAQAVPHLQSAAALNPNIFEYRFYLGQALNATSEFAAALPTWRPPPRPTPNPRKRGTSSAWPASGPARPTRPSRRTGRR